MGRLHLSLCVWRILSHDVDHWFVLLCRSLELFSSVFVVLSSLITTSLLAHRKCKTAVKYVTKQIRWFSRRKKNKHNWFVVVLLLLFLLTMEKIRVLRCSSTVQRYSSDSMTWLLLFTCHLTITDRVCIYLIHQTRRMEINGSQGVLDSCHFSCPQSPSVEDWITRKGFPSPPSELSIDIPIKSTRHNMERNLLPSLEWRQLSKSNSLYPSQNGLFSSPISRRNSSIWTTSSVPHRGVQRWIIYPDRKAIIIWALLVWLVIKTELQYFALLFKHALCQENTNNIRSAYAY